jgi:membrane protein implicated in regulation of membrane protease activity
MVNFFSSLLLALIVLIIVLIATFIVTTGFLFVGGVLAQWFSLTRLEATGVTLVVGILLTYLIVRIIEIPAPFAPAQDSAKKTRDESPSQPHLASRQQQPRE